MTLQPQTTEQFAWVTAIEVLVFVTLVLFWWQKKGGNQQKQNRELRFRFKDILAVTGGVVIGIVVWVALLKGGAA
jgi:hypothetical protein